jgi:hypothetical protein
MCDLYVITVHELRPRHMEAAEAQGAPRTREIRPHLYLHTLCNTAVGTLFPRRCGQGYAQGCSGHPSAAAINVQHVAPSSDSRTMSA